MVISFHGAARTVTGSKHRIQLSDGFQILLDCGMFQGMGAKTQSLNETFGFDAAKISVLLLSHAHIDHSGLIPKLVAEGFTGKIYCTEATRDLTEILLYDSAEIQSHPNPGSLNQPLYDIADAKNSLAHFEVVDYDQWISISPNVHFLLTETGHLMGGAAIHVKIREGEKETTISYSADVGRARHPLLKPAAEFPQADYIILESTYGDKHHDLHAGNIDILLKWIQKACIEKKGKLIIPAFSVGRTQEILFMLNQLELEKRLPDLKYFVDSPLSLRATETLKSYVGQFNGRIQEILKIDDDPFLFKGLKHVESAEDSRRLMEHDEPCVIISSSGTADAGRVRHHIRHCISDARHTILFSGYCGPESLGGTLLSGAKHIEIFEEKKEVHAEIGQLKGLSAHGDTDDLCQFISCQDPGQVRGVFLVHGEYRVQEKLSARLLTKGYYPVTIPDLHEEIVLNRHAVEHAGETNPVETV